MSNNKKSSVEWLFEQIYNPSWKIMLGEKTLEILEQAKAQHKKETIDFALHCMMPKMNPDKATIEVVSDIYDEYFGGDQ